METQEMLHPSSFKLEMPAKEVVRGGIGFKNYLHRQFVSLHQKKSRKHLITLSSDYGPSAEVYSATYKRLQAVQCRYRLEHSYIYPPLSLLYMLTFHRFSVLLTPHLLLVALMFVIVVDCEAIIGGYRCTFFSSARMNSLTSSTGYL